MTIARAIVTLATAPGRRHLHGMSDIEADTDAESDGPADRACADCHAGDAGPAVPPDRRLYLRPFRRRGDGADRQQAGGDAGAEGPVRAAGHPDHGAPAREPVRFGGPVETGRGFVLHSADYGAEGATLVDARGVDDRDGGHPARHGAASGPERAMVALGYAGWSAAQLENEIRANDRWLVSRCGCRSAVRYAKRETKSGARDAQDRGRPVVALGRGAGLRPRCQPSTRPRRSWRSAA